MEHIHVRHEGGDRYVARIREHEVAVDQPAADGGTDTAPTPVELFAAALASCVAHYAGRYLRRHGLPEDGLSVECAFEMAGDRPARVERIRLATRLPDGFPPERRAALLAVVEHCTVHNSITRRPSISIELEADERAA